MKRLARHDAGGVVRGVIATLLPDFSHHLRDRGEKGNSHRYTRDLKRLCAYFGWQTTDQIPADVIEQVRAAFSHTSAYRKQLAIVGFLRWAAGSYHINERALAVPLIPPPPRSMSSWTVETEELILTSLRAPMVEIPHRSGMSKRQHAYCALAARYDQARRQSLYGILLLCLRWAVRRREIVEICVKDWDSTSGTLTIRKSSTRRGQTRTFEVDRYTADVLDALCASRDPDERMFPAHNGRRLNVDHLSKNVRGFFRQIGLRASFQDCHHYAVRSVLERMKGQEQHAFSIIGFARRSQARLYEAKSEAPARERLRAQAVFDDIACHFRVADKPADDLRRSGAGCPDLPDFAELIRPLLKTLDTDADESSVSAGPQ